MHLSIYVNPLNTRQVPTHITNSHLGSTYLGACLNFPIYLREVESSRQQLAGCECTDCVRVRQVQLKVDLVRALENIYVGIHWFIYWFVFLNIMYRNHEVVTSHSSQVAGPRKIVERKEVGYRDILA